MYSWQPILVCCFVALLQPVTASTLASTSLMPYAVGSGPGAPMAAGGPYGGVVRGLDGNFYGTTSSVMASDGSISGGTIFQFTPSGTVTILAFLGADAYPGVNGPLVQDSLGNFYGTTNPNGGGSVYELSASGTISTLAQLDSTVTGSTPFGGLLLGGDGTLYGTTTQGGAYNGGTIFSISPTGTFSTLAELDNLDAPYGALLQGPDGTLYGTSTQGNFSFGQPRGGFVFSLSPTGTLTTLAGFSVAGPYRPQGGLVPGHDGNFYGTLDQGGASNAGGLYQLTADGTLTIVHTFDFTDGANPTGALIQGADGTFYGTTLNGGSANSGTLFQLSASGTLSTLFNFFADAGVQPYGGIVKGGDGALYGTTVGGGVRGDGTVFRFNPATTETVSFSSAASIPITASVYAIYGSALSVQLNYPPAPGDVLTVIRPTGPDPIVGSFSNLPDTGTIVASFGGVGYSFTASYSGGSGHDLTLTQTGTTTGTTFAAWEAGYLFTGTATAIPLNDGVPNLLKYLSDIDPTRPMSAADRRALATLFLDSATNPGTTYLALKFRKYRLVTGLVVNLQTSTDLQNWQTVQPAINQQVGTDANGDPILEMGVSATGGPTQFLRLEVELP